MITKVQALEIAREECLKRGWLWPVNASIKWGLINYTVWGGGQKGGNLCIKVNKRSGEVASAGVSPL